MLLADAQTGAVRTLFEDKDAAWIDYVRSLDWVQGGKGLLFLSERDGWRHAYVISGADGKAKLITNFSGDVISEVRAGITPPLAGDQAAPAGLVRPEVPAAPEPLAWRTASVTASNASSVEAWRAG